VSVDSFFGGLVRLRHHYSHIKSVTTRDCQRTPALTAFVVAALSSLESLTLATPDGKEIPKQISDAMTKLKRLDKLTILGQEVWFVDSVCDLRATPIRRLIATSPQELLYRGRGVKLHELDILNLNIEQCDIPWATLKALRLPGEHRCAFSLIHGTVIEPSLKV